MIESWQLAPYETAAREICLQLNESPDQLVPQKPTGFLVPNWTVYAEEMFKLRLMMTTMQVHNLL